MNVLVIGSGGREHALVWKLRQSPVVRKVFCAPGNAGTAREAENVPLKGEDFAALAGFVRKNRIDLTIVGPEAPLAGGIVDFFAREGLPIFGPTRRAAQLESSKSFAKDFMHQHGIPTAAYRTFSDPKKAYDFIDTFDGGRQIVVKADGLAAGKGVIICPDRALARNAVEEILEKKAFGAAGNEVVVEEFLRGEEASVQVFLDGEHYHAMVAAQDHKRVNDGDRGPNTGGMGAYAPAPIVDDDMKKTVEDTVIKPLIAGLKKEDIEYRGVIYLGLMITGGKPYVLEFNCRFGDPETQAVLPLLKTDFIEIVEKIDKVALDKIKIEWYNKTALCVVLCSKGYPGEYEKGKRITGLDGANTSDDTMVFHAGTALKGQETITSGGRVLGVTALGATIKDARDSAYTAVGRIAFDGMHYRSDIGRRAIERMKRV